MTTDPLCPQQHTHPKHDPNRCIFCEYGGAVREDERQRVTSDFAEYLRHMEEWQAGYSKGHAAGVEQGQRDERERIASAVQREYDKWKARADDSDGEDSMIGRRYIDYSDTLLLVLRIIEDTS